MDDREETEPARYSLARSEGLVDEASSMKETGFPERSRLAACTDFCLAYPGKCAIFLDVDGTLLELAATPKSISVPAGLVASLMRVQRALDGALAIMTGRRIAEVDEILSPLRLAASGVHGAELRPTPDSPIERMTPNLAETTVHALRKLAGLAPGAFAEPKGSGLAIHYRLAPDAETTIAGALQEFHDQHNGQFKIWPGQKVFEVIPAGFSKGTALTTFAALSPFKDRIPIMIGDDVGDEPAFAEAERLNGYGLRVAGENFPEAHADFDGPKSVLTWLDRLGRRLG